MNTNNALSKNELRSAIMSFKSAFITVAAFSFFLNALMLVPSIYMMQIYDRVLVSRNVTTLAMLTIVAVGLYVLMIALESVRTFVMVRIGAKLDERLKTRVFDVAFERNLVRPGSNVIQLLNDLTTVRQTLTGAGLIALFDIPWMPVYLFVIFAFSTQIGILVVVGALILAALALINERVSRPLLDESSKVSAQANNLAASNLRNAEVISAMGMLGSIRKRWYAKHLEFLQKQAKASDRSGVLTGLTKFVRIAMQSMVLGYGAYETLQGRMSPGMIIAASILSGRALAPMEMLITNWRQLVSGRESYDSLKEVFEQFPEREAGMSLPPPTGKVSVEGVSAAPPGVRRMVLNQVSFTIDAGQVVAMIGPSASGKSSLARLLVGVWEPVMGAVRLDGADVFKWNKDELGPHIGYLPQDIELFSGTIAENIARFGEIDPAKVVEAATRTGMHEHILRLAQGYDTQLGEAGGSLSGGQRQRIGLARAIYDDPALIVLDEPNSNLDDQGEFALIETIKDLKARGKTVILITHRMGTLSVVDKVLVLQDGAVTAFGLRDEVLAPIFAAQAARARGGTQAVARPAGGGGPGAPGPGGSGARAPGGGGSGAGAPPAGGGDAPPKT
ncbi:MAG: type I secretion system permease/ATPase [Burkholderiaceae bacterium]|nr:type I secretion system permease/ATPase [Burkholderiaceae bacterium]